MLGLWLTPLGVGCAYYFIPQTIGKPSYSYALSLIGFWGLALFYSQVGIHHLIGGPVPTWVVTLSVVHSAMMFISVIAVGVNQHVAVARNTWALKESMPLRFIAFGAVMYTYASFQGSIEALRSVNTVTHFTHYIVGHAHLGAYGRWHPPWYSTSAIWGRRRAGGWRSVRLRAPGLSAWNLAQGRSDVWSDTATMLVTLLLLGRLLDLNARRSAAEALQAMEAVSPELAVVEREGLTLASASGDSIAATRSLGQSLGLDLAQFHGALTPLQKVAVLEALPRPCGFVDDGANGGLSLTAADCGGSVTSAHSAAAQTADVVILQGGLERLLPSITLSRRQASIAAQNLVLGMGYNLAILSFAALACCGRSGDGRKLSLGGAEYFAVGATGGANVPELKFHLRLLGQSCLTNAQESKTTRQRSSFAVYSYFFN